MADFIQQLKALRNDSQAGAASQSEHLVAKAKLLASIGHESSEAEAPVTSSPVYVRWYVRNLISRPIAIGVSGFVLMTSGWLTTVSAAADSLPGDPLYSIKLVTERAQIQLASLDRKAVLHTEFAERRLKEVSALQNQKAVDINPTLVRVAVDAYKQELASANANLVELQGNDEQATVETAGLVQQRMSALEVTIGTVVNDSVTPTTPEVLEVQESTREASDAAVDVAVEATERADIDQTESAGQSKLQLEEVFHRELGALQARQSFDLHRGDVIKATVALQRNLLQGVDLPSGDELSRLRRDIDQATETVPDAFDAFAAGSFRVAFDLLHEADIDLLELEAQLAAIEIQLTSAISAALQPVAQVGGEPNVIAPVDPVILPEGM
ncbi:MAG: DUF5667 domain-containing protein [Candidatus Uhrbacteria bacterium]|nr:DUF5667 domain-containing protein [Candidatus Uhrbacteria bacterium]